jgi:hypothetical protein
VCPMQQFRCELRNRNMITNSKSNCINDLSASMSRTANWRRGLLAKFNDPRNALAAATLDRFADEIGNLSDEDWAELQHFYSWSSTKWSEAVSLASRRVVFQRNVKTMDDYLNQLVGILLQSVAA